MSKQKVHKRKTEAAEKSDVRDVNERRQRLAQMIGQLLARTWLQSRRNSAAMPTAESSEVAANQA